MIPQAITSRGGAFNPRMILAAALCLMGVFLAAFSFGAPSLKGSARSTPARVTGSPSSPNSAANWSVVPSPNLNDGPRSNSLSGLDCSSASDCWAVGVHPTTSSYQGLIEHWNGTSWAIAMFPTDTDRSVLNDVTCNSTSDCWAVGRDDSGALIARWNGTSWSKVDSHDDTHAGGANAVACNSSADCWAVGSYYTGTVSQTFIGHWNGSTWTRLSSPNVDTTHDNILTGIACTSANNCWAAGYYWTNSASKTLIEHWNGTDWSIINSPNIGTNRENYLNDVACNSSSDCWAVGSADPDLDYYQELILHWNGVVWVISPSPSTGTENTNELFGLVCNSSADCWATGEDYDMSATRILHWDGTAWSVVDSPDRYQFDDDVLLDVNCTSASDCRAVGYSGSTSRTLVEHWNGKSWAIESSPNIDTGYRPNKLSDVTCVTESDCWVVGTHDDSPQSDTKTLTGHWDGTEWRVVTSANDPTTGWGVLEGVACSNSNDCWAVGWVGNYISSQIMVEHWNGGPEWVLVSAPNPAATQNRLFSVDCTSSSDCWAVGASNFSNSSSDWKTFIEHWNGIAWTITPSPNIGTGDYLSSVTCVASDNCWAVGYSISLTLNYDRTLIEHWNGSIWAIVSSPNSSSTESNRLESVTCLAASDCWAVGHAEGSGAANRTLAQHWDGATWSIVASPNADINAWNALYSVACSSSSNCWSVGLHYSRTTGGYVTLIEHWNGSAWEIVDSPSPATSYNPLFGVVCPSPTSCWAAGSQSPAPGIGYEQTLIEHYTAALEITSASRSHGQFSLTGQTVANASVNIQASPNLVAPFVTIDTVTANAAGVFEYIDPNSSSFQKRFYRAVFP
jgi:hypothetical protein